MAQEERRSSQKLLRLTLDYKCKVEEIARRQPVTTVVGSVRFSVCRAADGYYCRADVKRSSYTTAN